MLQDEKDVREGWKGTASKSDQNRLGFRKSYGAKIGGVGLIHIGSFGIRLAGPTSFLRFVEPVLNAPIQDTSLLRYHFAVTSKLPGEKYVITITLK